jgi:cation:H+ antiporter
LFHWSLPVWGECGLFIGAAVFIALAGAKASNLADRLADRTGLGEALTGTIFLGFLTALPGLVASLVAALDGYASLAIHNAMGGVAIQTTALAVADLAHRKANLEHAAASAENMMQSISLIMLLTLALGGLTSPDVTVTHIHPMTVILFMAGGGAFYMALRTRQKPMWSPRKTKETVEDKPNPDHTRENLAKLITLLVIAAMVTAVAGAVVGEAATNIVKQTGSREAVVGGLFMAIATSLPELVTSVAAVRQGALTMAVSSIVGGNFFDVLFVAAADLAYLHGSIYHAQGVGQDELFLTTLTILLNVVLLMGLIYRQKSGPANIGFESVTMLGLYIAGFLILSLMM